MTSDGRGGAFVVWHDARNVASWDVYTQRVDRDGTGCGHERRAGHDGGGNQIAWPVAADGEDGAVYAWSDDPAGHEDVFVQRLGPTGAPLACRTAYGSRASRATSPIRTRRPLAPGKFLVTWDDWSNSGSAAMPRDRIDLLGQGGRFPEAAGLPARRPPRRRRARGPVHLEPGRGSPAASRARPTSAPGIVHDAHRAGSVRPRSSPAGPAPASARAPTLHRHDGRTRGWWARAFSLARRATR